RARRWSATRSRRAQRRAPDARVAAGDCRRLTRAMSSVQISPGPVPKPRRRDVDISRNARRHRSAGAALAVLAAALTVAACGSSGDDSTSSSTTKAAANANKPVRIAYLSFAVANSYDAPMLAAAQTVAKDNNSTIKVFDAANDPKKQFAQLQTATSSGDYDAIIVQPIFGTGLITGVQDAIAAGKKVVNMDQILGKDLSTDQPQVDGLSGNVVFVPTEIGTKLGNLVKQACQESSHDPCKIGYLYEIKASALGV